MTAALLKGDPDARGVLRQTLLDRRAERLPSRGGWIRRRVGRM